MSPELEKLEAEMKAADAKVSRIVEEMVKSRKEFEAALSDARFDAFTAATKYQNAMRAEIQKGLRR